MARMPADGRRGGGRAEEAEGGPGGGSEDEVSAQICRRATLGHPQTEQLVSSQQPVDADGDSAESAQRPYTEPVRVEPRLTDTFHTVINQRLTPAAHGGTSRTGPPRRPQATSHLPDAGSETPSVHHRILA